MESVTGRRQSSAATFGPTWNRHAWIPGSKHKNAKSYAVPLNQMAMEVLARKVGKHMQRVFAFMGEPIHQVNTKAWTKALGVMFQ